VWAKLSLVKLPTLSACASIIFLSRDRFSTIAQIISATADT